MSIVPHGETCAAFCLLPLLFMAAPSLRLRHRHLIIALHGHHWHNPYPQLAAEVRAAASNLAALKFEVLEKVGEAVGNVQTYQL